MARHTGPPNAYVVLDLAPPRHGGGTAAITAADVKKLLKPGR